MATTTPPDLTTPKYLEKLRLDGKVFVIFGAGQGIGAETAHALSQAGAKVACVGRGADATKAIALAVGGTAILGDATDRSDVERIFSEVAGQLGRVDGLVDILGEPRVRPFGEMTDADWEWQFNIGLRHVFLTAQIGFPLMASTSGGTAVYVSSIAGMSAAKNQSVYGAAKAALQQLVKSLAVEYGPKGIRVNAVVPGVIRTPRVVDNFPDARLADIAGRYPLRELGVPADIASAALFLSTALSRHVTGQSLIVDGGVTSQSPLYNLR